MAALASQQFGVLSTAELRACGLSRDAIAVRVRQGWLHRRHTGVYAVGHPGLELRGEFLAALKACGPGAALSHRAAAVLWALLEWDEGWPIDVTVPGTAFRTHAGLRVHRSGLLLEGDVARRDGMRVTSPAWTLLDLAAVLPPAGLRRAVRRAQAMRLVHVAQLVALLARAGRRRGVAELAALVATGPAPTRSELEDVVLDLLLRGGVAAPEVNVPLEIGGRRLVPDYRWPAQRLVLEADGAAWHDDPLARAADAERQALLEAAGERVLRVTWQQAVTQPAQTLARLAAAGAPPASR